MKVRTPISVYIVLTFCLIALAFEMFAPEVHYLTSPYFWVVVIMSALLLLIVSSLQDLVENENFKKLTDEEKKLYLEQKDSFCEDYGILLLKSSLRKKKQILL